MIFHRADVDVVTASFHTEDANPEAELNKIYNSVRTKLPQKQRDLLRDEQKNWLKLREEINGDNSKTRFTNHRIVELRARLEQDYQQARIDVKISWAAAFQSRRV